MSHIGESDKIKFGEKASMDGVLNSELLRIAVGNKICERHPDSIADCANEVIGDILQFHDERHDRVWPLWQFANAQTERLASRTSSRLQAELLLMVELLLPGTPILFYGDELFVQDAQDMVSLQLVAQVKTIFRNTHKEQQCLGTLIRHPVSRTPTCSDGQQNYQPTGKQSTLM